MTIKALLLLCSLLPGPPSAEAASAAASIYYFDHNYDLISDMPELAIGVLKADPSVSIRKSATEKTYTNGARFVIDKPDALNLAELNGTTYYAEAGAVEILEGGHAIMLPPQAALDSFTPALREEARPYFTVERLPARLLAGNSPSGHKFTVLELPHLKARPLWEPSILMRHFVYDGVRDGMYVSIPMPLGLNGISRRMGELASDKRSSALLSLGAGGWLAARVLNSGPERSLKYLASTGADIAMLEVPDLKNFWHWSADIPRISSGVPEFICTNLKISDPALAALIKPYAIRRLGGMDVAFISLVPYNDAVKAELRGAPFEVTDPADRKNLSALLKELRGQKKVKFVVAAASLSREELGRVTGLKGIDALIGPKTWDNESGRRTRVELRKWEKEAHTGPALIVYPDSGGAGELRAEFGPLGALTALEALPPPSDDREPLLYRENLLIKERIIRYYLGSGDSLLPDLNDLGSGAVFAIPDFYSLAANLTRKAVGAEVAVLKVSPFTSNVAGDIPFGMVMAWLGPNEKLALVSAPGFFLKDFIGKRVPRRDPQAAYHPDGYSNSEYYAVSGLDASGLIAGLPLNPNERYLAVLPESLIVGRPFIRRLPLPQGAHTSLHGTIAGALKDIRERCRSHSDWAGAVWKETDPVSPARDLWRINLRSFSIEAVNTAVTGPAGYASVNESRLSANNQTRIQGSARLYSEYLSGRFRLDAGIAADYGRTAVRPRGAPRLTTESVDQLIYEGQLVYRARKYDGGLGRILAGPYASVAYDTEFSRSPGSPLRKVLRGGGGLKLFEGAVLQELYAGLSTEQVYTYVPARTKYALEAGFRLTAPLPGTTLTLDANGNYRRFARSRFDTANDLLDRLDLNVKLSTKLYGDILISPFVNYFMATGKKLPASASNFTTGFSLNYALLFKVKR